MAVARDPNSRPQERTFAISLVVRDAQGRVRGRKYFATDSGDSLADFYGKHSTNELDFPTTGKRRRAKMKNNPKKKKQATTEKKS